MCVCVCLSVCLSVCLCVCVCACVCSTTLNVACYALKLIIPLDSGDILIASCGQDMFVRVWRLSKEQAKDSSTVDDELKVKKNSFTVSSQGNNYHRASLSRGYKFH